MIHPNEVSAVLVTRGNVDMREIVDSITAAGIQDIVIWNNADRPTNLSCYGRYVGILEARNPFIYHQDDDLVAPVADILAAYDPDTDRDAIVANNRPDEEWRLTAMGVVFHRSLASMKTFFPYTARFGYDDDFFRVSDVVFAYQHPYRRITVGYRDLPWAADPTCSMYLEDGHMAVRERALARLREMGAVCEEQVAA